MPRKPPFDRTLAVLLAIAALISACSGPVKPMARTGPASRPALVLAATAGGAGVRVYAVGHKMALQREVPLSGQVVDLRWVAADKLAVLLEGGEAKLISGSKAASVAVPGADAWRVQNPNPKNEAVRSRFPCRARLSRARDGGLWLAHCAWVHEGDGDPCATRVHARLWPSPRPPGLKAPVLKARRDPPSGSPAEGYRVLLRTDNKAARLKCVEGGVITQRQIFSHAPCHHTLKVTWLGVGSRRFLLTAEADCGVSDTPDRKRYLMEACTDRSTEVSDVAWGPGGVVALNLEQGGKRVWRIERGGRALGTIEGQDLLRFWPR